MKAIGNEKVLELSERVVVRAIVRWALTVKGESDGEDYVERAGQG